ncbi:MAG: hypothetical protein ACRAVC_22945 [Trichormus sp.]
MWYLPNHKAIAPPIFDSALRLSFSITKGIVYYTQCLKPLMGKKQESKSSLIFCPVNQF